MYVYVSVSLDARTVLTERILSVTLAKLKHLPEIKRKDTLKQLQKA
jgi:hypothetical protein